MDIKIYGFPQNFLNGFLKKNSKWISLEFSKQTYTKFYKWISAKFFIQIFAKNFKWISAQIFN